MKRRVFLVSIVLAMSAAGCGNGRNSSLVASPPVVPVVRAACQTLGTELEIAAEFRPYQEIDLYAKVSGYIKELYIDWGSHVKKGQLLAVLEIPELEHKLQQDRAAVRRNQHELTRSGEELKRLESAYRVAHLTYTRLAEVQKSQAGLVAQQEIDVAQGKDREASAQVSAAKAAEQAAEEALIDTEAALKQDETLYAYSQIRAPFEGVVTRLDAYVGALLPAATSSDKSATPLCHLSQNNLLRLVIPLPQSVVTDVTVGQRVDVRVETLAKTFKGKIALFNDQLDFATRTMHTEVTVPNSTHQLVPGMYASVKIPLRRAENAVAVPIQAVRLAGGSEGIILVVNPENKIEQRHVTLGVQTATDVEIRSGVQANELIVFGDQSPYAPGELVAPKEVTALPHLD
jgi:RND family efflux transporter MFP subunit